MHQNAEKQKGNSRHASSVVIQVVTPFFPIVKEASGFSSNNYAHMHTNTHTYICVCVYSENI